MMLRNLCILLLLCAKPVLAEQILVNTALDQHILPSFKALEEKTQDLAQVASLECDADAPGLRAAFGQAFDAWVEVSHLRFGPSEDQNRAFAIAFWPDTKGFTGKTLNKLIQGQDPVVYDPVEFSTISIAGRGLYALELLLFDPNYQAPKTADYRCAMVQAITHDIHDNAARIKWGWADYQKSLRQPTENGPYKTEKEALREVFKSLQTGLEFTANARIGRPLGSIDRPRPRRAEAWRSARSLRHIQRSLISTQKLALILSADEPLISKGLMAAYDRALELIQDLNDPTLSSVTDQMGRFRVEILQQAVLRIDEILTEELAPALGVTAGFNALDGD